MNISARKKLFRWAWIVLLVYFLGGIALYFLQDYILFHPLSLRKEYAYNFSEPHREITVPIDETDSLNMVDFAVTGAAPRGLVLYFHGNRKNISWYAKYMPFFTRNGYEVLMIDYPGFGKSKGRLTEQKLYFWALQAYRIAIKKYAADSIIIYGKSMGTGIAAQLASIRDCKRLILETPYYDFPSVVRHYLPFYPVAWMLHYQLPTWQYLQQVAAPVSLLHGTNDWVVSYRNAKRLERYLKKGDELFTIPGGSHNNLFAFPQTGQHLDSLLNLP